MKSNNQEILNDFESRLASRLTKELTNTSQYGYAKTNEKFEYMKKELRAFTIKSNLANADWNYQKVKEALAESFDVSELPDSIEFNTDPATGFNVLKGFEPITLKLSADKFKKCKAISNGKTTLVTISFDSCCTLTVSVVKPMLYMSDDDAFYTLAKNLASNSPSANLTIVPKFVQMHNTDAIRKYCEGLLGFFNALVKIGKMYDDASKELKSAFDALNKTKDSIRLQQDILQKFNDEKTRKSIQSNCMQKQQQTKYLSHSEFLLKAVWNNYFLLNRYWGLQVFKNLLFCN